MTPAPVVVMPAAPLVAPIVTEKKGRNKRLEHLDKDGKITRVTRLIDD